MQKLRLAFATCTALLATAGAASAEPSAHYNTATGGVTFVDLSTVYSVRLQSTLGPLTFANAIGAPELSSDAGGARIQWGNNNQLFAADFFGGNIVPVGRPASSLFFSYFIGQREFISGPIVTIPEPSSFATAAFGMFTLGLARHRQRRAPHVLAV
jgi:hypothetical protein